MRSAVASPIRSPIRVDRSRTRFECPERKGKRSSSAPDREVRMEREKLRTFSRNPIPWARIAAISDVIGANVFRSSCVNARWSLRFVR